MFNNCCCIVLLLHRHYQQNQFIKNRDSDGLNAIAPNSFDQSFDNKDRQKVAENWKN